MKFACKVCVSNRELGRGGGGGGSGRYVNGTVALCALPKSPDYCVLVFTGRDKAGAKYPLRGNVRAVLARFAAEGKATLQFTRPPHDLLLQAAEPVQLRAFLRLLRAALEPRAPPGTPGAASAPVLALRPAEGTAPAARVVRRLTVRSRADYPARGLPRTLEELHVNGVGRARLDPGVLSLTRLHTLDYSDNCLERLPDELALLPCLRDLDLSRNSLHLGMGLGASWGWMGGRLAATLVSLSLAGNGLSRVPDDLVKLAQLQHLDLRNNLLRRLPSGIGRLRQLRSLLCADNRLASLPGSIRNLRLQVLSVANNPFEPLSHDTGNPDAHGRLRRVRSLREYAARRVLACKLPYCARTVPATLADYLDHAEYCVCGEACFTVFFKQSLILPLSSIANELTLSPGDDGYVPVDGYFCSMSCYNSCRTRYRGHIVR